MSVTTSYGTWLNHAGEDSPAYTILNAVGDDYADFDLTAIETEYRDAIDAALPNGVGLSGKEFLGPYYEADREFDGYPVDEDGNIDIPAVIAGIDISTIVDRHELWAIDQVADHLDYKGASAAGTARKTLSRWGVARHDMVEHPDSGRPQARYRAADVKAARAAAPGQGARTDTVND
ncbi:hypothetical protein ACFYPN_15960 [Streptomyces sp. NPDC005576]|uniref:hypothetical protein n=1 Tax=Streptomyces sp. NPDC005576 TaxID=3364726 RepID=UPI0036BF70B2